MSVLKRLSIRRGASILALAMASMVVTIVPASGQEVSALDPWGLGSPAEVAPSLVRDFASGSTSARQSATQSEHCALQVVAEGGPENRLLASSPEICFVTKEVLDAYLSDNGIVGPTHSDSDNQTASGSLLDQQAVVAPFIIGEHFDGLGFTGSSLTLSGVDCLGGGLSLTGTAWDNRIRSTRNGCRSIAHYDGGDPAPYAAPVEFTPFPGRDLTILDLRTSGIRYFGGDDFDTDGDALLDSWETDGIDWDANGTIDLDLPAMGADPLKKDVFLEIDWEDGEKADCRWFSVRGLFCEGGRDSGLPSERDLLEIVEAFDAAPVQNPDGSTGVTLHIDAGATFPMYLDGPDWGGRSRSTKLDIEEVGELSPPFCDYIWDDFDSVIKANFFDRFPRGGVFHYALIAPSHDSPGSCDGYRTVGIARGIPGSDFIVFNNDPDGYSSRDVALAIMHELGHTLGLKHGGDQDLPIGGPNFLSVMNYLYADLGGIGVVGSDARAFGYSTLDLGVLDEASLNEAAGLQNSLPPQEIDYYCPERDEDFVFQRRSTQTGTRIDWDCDGNDAELNVINRNLGGRTIGTSVDGVDVFHSNNDWLDIEFAGGWIGKLLTDLPALEQQSPSDPPIDTSVRDQAFTISVGAEQAGFIGESSAPVAVKVVNAGTQALSLNISIIDEFDVEQAVVSVTFGSGSEEILAMPIPLIPGEYQVVGQVAGSDWIRDSAQFSLSVQSTIPPRPEDDSFDVSSSGSSSFDVLANDNPGTSPIDANTLSLLELPEGSASVANGVITYTPGPASSDYLRYQICDVINSCSSATVNVNVVGAGSPPVAVDDTAEVLAEETIDLDVLDNDTDPDDDIDEETLTIVSAPALGQAQVVTDEDGAALAYTAGTVAGVDSFVYQICDDTGECDTATVTITVMALSQCTITGTNGADTLNGTAGDDVICARGGNDVIDGRGGNDVIFGGNGADTIDGGNGNDIIRGGRGADTIRGQAGDDLIHGGRGGDSIEGNAGDDELHGGAGSDTLDGGAGSDILYSGKGQDVLNGGGGNDVLRGLRGADILNGNQGDDTIYGGRGNDTIYGNQGDDTMYGRRGNDTIYGGGGNDTANGGQGNDTCNAETKQACE